MKRLSESSFLAEIAQFDAAVDASTGIDRFCSSSDWGLPAHAALMPERTFHAARTDSIWIVGAIRCLADGMRLFEPLEGAWALASGLVGLRTARDARDTIAYLEADAANWDVALVAGLLSDSEQLKWIVSALWRPFRLQVGETTPRYVVELDRGVDAFLARRSRNFRRSLRRSTTRVRREGVVLEACHARSEESAAALFERVVAVEARSWKGIEEVGITSGAMCEFYRALTARLSRAGRLRCWFAVRDGRDLGYVLGGVRLDTYRGLQFSYDDSMSELGLGNVMQLEQMHELEAEGVLHYDLGSEAEYKRRWADRVLLSPRIYAFRR